MKKILLTLLCVFIVSICASSAFATGDANDVATVDSVQPFDEDDIFVSVVVDETGMDPVDFDDNDYDFGFDDYETLDIQTFDEDDIFVSVVVDETGMYPIVVFGSDVLDCILNQSKDFRPVEVSGSDVLNHEIDHELYHEGNDYFRPVQL